MAGDGRSVAVKAELDHLLECWVGVREAEARLRAAVAAARAVGVPWRQVGEVLGVTRQAAQARFRTRQQAGT